MNDLIFMLSIDGGEEILWCRSQATCSAPSDFIVTDVEQSFQIFDTTIDSHNTVYYHS